MSGDIPSGPLELRSDRGPQPLVLAHEEIDAIQAHFQGVDGVQWPTALGLWAALVSRAERGLTGARSVRGLAEAIGFSHRTLQRYLPELEGAGMLEIQRVDGSPNEYLLRGCANMAHPGAYCLTPANMAQGEEPAQQLAQAPAHAGIGSGSSNVDSNHIGSTPLTNLDHEFNDLLSYHADALGSSVPRHGTERRKILWDAFKARRKGGYSLDDLKRAVDNVRGDEWHVSKGQASLVSVLRPKNLPRLLEMSPANGNGHGRTLSERDLSAHKAQIVERGMDRMAEQARDPDYQRQTALDNCILTLYDLRWSPREPDPFSGIVPGVKTALEGLVSAWTELHELTDGSPARAILDYFKRNPARRRPDKPLSHLLVEWCELWDAEVPEAFADAARRATMAATTTSGGSQ